MNSDSSHPEPTPDSAPLDEQLVAYLDGELDEETARRIETLVAEDPALGDRLAQLGQTWEMLDELDRAETEGVFTEATLELVALQAEQEAQEQAAQEPKIRRRRRIMVGTSLLACALVGFLGVAMLRPDPNRPLIDDLPVIENVDEYIQILGNNDRVEPSIDLLKRLHEEKLFGKAEQNGEDKHVP